MAMTLTASLLAGKAALIIGASRGIGAATAAAFAANGARVVLAARGVEAMEALARTLRDSGADIRVVRTDVTDAASIRDAVGFTVECFGRLDIAFNNAAINSTRAKFADLSEDDFDAAIATNLRSVFVAMKHEIQAMLASGGGSIVNTSSAAGLVAFPAMAGYVASKHGVVGLTRTAALDYAAQRLRVNAIAPGAVLTEMLLAGTGATVEGRARIEAVTPMKRIAAPAEVAEAVVWLASERASYVTGAVVPVDGGYVLP
jgi:A-factor type gamma-butyrolactone 1'-reductase (1S-forming)